MSLPLAGRTDIGRTSGYRSESRLHGHDRPWKVCYRGTSRSPRRAEQEFKRERNPMSINPRNSVLPIVDLSVFQRGQSKYETQAVATKVSMSSIRDIRTPSKQRLALPKPLCCRCPCHTCYDYQHTSYLRTARLKSTCFWPSP